MSVRKSIEAWIRGYPLNRKTQVALQLASPLLRLLSYVTKGAILGKNFFYNRRLLPQKKVSTVVISIGNVVAGGTGKTPLTLLLAEELNKKYRVGIVLRGYRGKVEKGKEPKVVCRGHGPECSVEECGDEAFLLASRLPSAIVIAGKRRYKASQMAMGEGAEILILDDGLQHRQLYRDFEVVVVGQQEKYFLPRGLLRDDPRRVLEADLVVTKERGGCSLSSKIQVDMKVQNVLSYDGKEWRTLEKSKVGVFCGIGNPQGFLKTISSLGADIVNVKFLSDHETMEEENLLDFAKRSKELGAELLLCTEKDKVKLNAFVSRVPLPVVWIKSYMVVTENRELWEDFIRRIDQKLKAISINLEKRKEEV